MKSLLVALVIVTGYVPFLRGESGPVEPFEADADLTPQCRIDVLVFGRLARLKIEPARLCSDAVFIRRAYLDAIGTLPTAEETERFLADANPAKRRRLVEHLLARDEFADYWAMRWGDVLRIKAEFPINLWPNAVQAYHRWIRTSIKDNVPYDRFVREMLTASGSNFRVGQVNFYRAVQNHEPKTLAAAVALTFMGSRIERWPEDRRDGMAAFFSRVAYKPTGEWKEEIVFFDELAVPADAAPVEAMLPDGSRRRLAPDEDPRAAFAAWLITAKNPWFARCAVNRVWYWLLGRGIVEEPDDFRPDNPPSNPGLLDYLAKELVKAKYDLKHVYRLILNSKTYQLSCMPRSDRPEAAANFAYYPVRRLDAEVLADALCQVTGTTEEYSSLIPEPFTFIPPGRSIALADGSITSPFLETFGRPPRDTGVASERDNRPSAAGALHLLNSSHVRRKIAQGEKLREVIRAGRTPVEKVRNVYLAILSRPPTEEELLVLRDYGRSGRVKQWEVMVDLPWALVNSMEFLYKH